MKPVQLQAMARQRNRTLPVAVPLDHSGVAQ